VLRARSVIRALGKYLVWTSNTSMKRNLALYLLPIAFCITQILGLAIRTSSDQANALRERVDVSQDPHFRMLMENSRVRVWLLELRPTEKTGLVYRAHDFLQIPLQEAWLSTSIERKQPIPFWIEKKARFVRGSFAQIVQNTDPRTVAQMIEIEFIDNVGVERCGPEAQVSCGCLGASGGIVRIFSCGVLETDNVRISQLENFGGDKLGLSVVPTLVVAIDPVKIQATVTSLDVKLILAPGEVGWINTEGQSLQSLDQHSQAKAVTVEFKVSAPQPSSR
jgi:hypothetical protein